MDWPDAYTFMPKHVGTVRLTTWRTGALACAAEQSSVFAIAASKFQSKLIHDHKPDFAPLDSRGRLSLPVAEML